MNTSKMRNPVLPSPWTSRAPHGFGHLPKSLRLPYSAEHSFNGTIQTVRPRVHRHRSILKESAFFRNLNRNTLILSFPEVHPNQIDAALTLCDNDLSETISLLQLRIRILINRKMHLEQRHTYTTTSSAPVKSDPPKTVNYIPTKYSDVHIVEVANNIVNNNQMKVMEVNQNVLQMLETCKTTMLLPPKTTSEGSKLPSTTHTVTSSVSKNGGSSESEFSPTTTIGSSIRSDDSEKLKVYDFAEDEQVLYHLPKPSRKPINKVGIVLKKGKSGLSVKLL